MTDRTPTKIWADIVPEFFYDLISRVPPGVFLVVIILREFEIISGTSYYNLFEANTAFLLLLAFFLIGAGYSVGILLSIPGKCLLNVYIKKAWKPILDKAENTNLLRDATQKASPFKDLRLNSPSNRDKQFYHDIFRIMHDYLKINNDQAKALLPKMSGESSLCNNTAAALFVWGITHFVHSFILGGLKEVAAKSKELSAKISESIELVFAFPLGGLKEQLWANIFWLLLIVILICIIAWIGKKRYEHLVNRQFSFLRITLGEQ